MIKKFWKTILLRDIFDALIVGVKCCFKRPVTRKLSDMKRTDNFRGLLEVDKTVCMRCGLCEGVCPNKSVKLIGNDYPTFDDKTCCCCHLCRKACPKSAIKVRHD